MTNFAAPAGVLFSYRGGVGRAASATDGREAVCSCITQLAVCRRKLCAPSPFGRLGGAELPKVMRATGGTRPTSSCCAGRQRPRRSPRCRLALPQRRNPMMEVALDVRVSTNRQQQQETIAQQIACLRAHVTTQPDWHVAEEYVYRDAGYSGAKLNRPGLDRLRDRAAVGAFERVLITAPDRLARNYVHQMLLIEALTQHGCQIGFLERPMSNDPHDHLLLQIRGAVAAYERTLIADRRRRGRQAKIRSGLLLPWTVPPYGYLLDPEC